MSGRVCHDCGLAIADARFYNSVNTYRREDRRGAAV